MVDADIKLLAKNTNPNITTEQAVRILYPQFDTFPEGSSERTAMIKNARYRLFDYYQWLQGKRPDSEILKGLKLPKNAKEIIQTFGKRKSTLWPNQLNDPYHRRYQFYELDKKFNKPLWLSRRFKN